MLERRPDSRAIRDHGEVLGAAAPCPCATDLEASTFVASMPSPQLKIAPPFAVPAVFGEMLLTQLLSFALRAAGRASIDTSSSRPKLTSRSTQRSELF